MNKLPKTISIFFFSHDYLEIVYCCYQEDFCVFLPYNLSHYNRFLEAMKSRIFQKSILQTKRRYLFKIWTSSPSSQSLNHSNHLNVILFSFLLRVLIDVQARHIKENQSSSILLPTKQSYLVTNNASSSFYRLCLVRISASLCSWLLIPKATDPVYFKELINYALNFLYLLNIK